MNNISIVIPIYNEEKFLKQQVNKLLINLGKEKIENHEILLIENGSTDKTYSIAKKMASKNPSIRLIRLHEPCYGEAMKIGLQKSLYKTIIQFDIDFIDMNFLKKAIALLDKYDVIVGSKLHKKSKDMRSIWRIKVTKIVNYLIRNIFFYKGTDTHGIKAYNKESISTLVPEVVSNHHFYDTELLLRAQNADYSIKELPVDIKELRKSRFPAALRLIQSIKEFIYLIHIRKELNPYGKDKL